MSVLPPLRVVGVVAAVADDACIRVLPDGDDVLARAFGAVLAESRTARGLDVQQIVLFAPAGDPAGLPPVAPNGLMWAPHILSYDGRPVLVWEAGAPAALAAVLEAPPEEIAIWAAQPTALLRMAAAAPQAVGPLDAAGPYLSLRWVLAHGQSAGAAASLHVAFDHVSIHATPQRWPAYTRCFATR